MSVIFTSRLLANDSLDLEIGVPQPMETSSEKCSGSVISPDGEHFYTLRQEFLTQYRIRPLSMVGSIKIDREELENTREERSCRVLLSNDKSKLIIVFGHKVLLFDAGTGKVLNKFERRDWGTGFVGAALNGNELLLLDRVSEDDGKYFDLTIWDANTLKFKRVIHDLGMRFGLKPNSYNFGAISKVQDRIYLSSGWSLLVLNSETYAPELFVLCNYGCGDPKLSKDLQKIYVWRVLSVEDYLGGKKTPYKDTRNKSVMVFDQITRKLRLENRNDISRMDLEPVSVNRNQISRAGDYMLLSSPRSTEPILVNLKTDMIFRFLQYNSEEFILGGKQRGQIGLKYYYLTPGARKYLMMKRHDGNVVPINDATFEKYCRVIEEVSG